MTQAQTDDATNKYVYSTDLDSSAPYCVFNHEARECPQRWGLSGSVNEETQLQRVCFLQANSKGNIFFLSSYWMSFHHSYTWQEQSFFE